MIRFNSYFFKLSTLTFVMLSNCLYQHGKNPFFFKLNQYYPLHTKQIIIVLFNWNNTERVKGKDQDETKSQSIFI